ncbi:MAG: hypothetical protein ACI8P2_004334 [Candidatus Latescibacterota bacterium]|jgi:hypothetical protein
MKRGNIFFRIVLVLCAGVMAHSTGPAVAQDTPMSLFITSSGPGNGADLGGIAGADAHCQTLADAAGAGEQLWRAYLSTQATAAAPAINARDRIGSGPWYNALGVMVAENVDQLHGENNLNKETALDERGEVVNGRGDSPNQHDILTGSQLDGTAFTTDGDLTCGNWTSGDEGSAQLGHHDRQGGGANPTSWNSAHASRGCSASNLQSSGGNGYFYCFALAANGDTAVREDFQTGQPQDSALYANYPNPFNSGTVLRFDLSARGSVSLAVFNLSGQQVALLVSGERAAGRYEIQWDGRDDAGRSLASGMYVYRLQAAGHVETRKLMLLR